MFFKFVKKKCTFQPLWLILVLICTLNNLSCSNLKGCQYNISVGSPAFGVGAFYWLIILGSLTQALAFEFQSHGGQKALMQAIS